MKVGIIGAGTMGSGIAQSLLQTVKTRLQKVFRDWLQKERKHRKMLMQS